MSAQPASTTPVNHSYAAAPNRTITAGGITFAYLSLIHI